MSKQFAVIGMGRVGASLVKTLDSLGHDVLGIDCDGDRIQDLSDELPGASLIAADATGRWGSACRCRRSSRHSLNWS